MSSQIRKQPDDLTAADLLQYPLWVDCLDEEGIEGQDESTSKPVEDARDGYAISEVGSYLVGVRYTFACGRELLGTIQIHFIDGMDVPEIASRSHCVFTHGESICLELGAEAYVPKAKARSKVDEIYAALNLRAAEVFPVEIRTLIRLEGVPARWTLPGVPRAPHHSNKTAFVV